jgi:hypothetical protein
MIRLHPCLKVRACTLSLSIASLLATVPAHASKDSVPDWVQAAIAQPKGTYSPETSAVVLLDDTVLSVGNDGKAVERRRHVVRILRPNGRDEGVIVVPYDKDSKILSLHVWSVGPDGHEYAMKDNEIADEGYPGGGGMYFDERFKVANAPGRDPGGVVAYEVEQRIAPYDHETTWHFQGDIPHVKQSFTLEVPPNYTYVSVWAHHDSVKAIDLEHQRYRWEMNDVPGIDLDRVPMHPSAYALEGRMTVHYGPVGASGPPLGSWQEIGEWYDALSRDRMVANPEIAAKAAELTAGKTDFYDKTEAITEFVQKQIRYFVIEKGIGGIQPHPASDIFRNRFGDCKDKATLLSAMLSTVGVHSVIVLVDTNRGFVDPDAPSERGNHAIGAIEIPNGYDSPKLRSVVTAKTGKRYLIVDPTWEKTPFGQLESDLQGGFGVLVEGKDSQVIPLPVLNPELNKVQRSAKFQLDADGSLKGSIVEKRFGDLSESGRELYSTGDAKEQKSVLDRRLSQDFSSFSVADFKVENVDALNKDLTTSFSLTADRFAKPTGTLLMVRPRVLGSEGLPIDRKVRVVPIDLRQTMVSRDDFDIEIPAGYAIDEMPDPVKVDMGFASYESASKLDGNVLHYSRTYTVRQVSLPANRYGDVQKLAALIAADEQSKAVLKKK